MGKVPVIISSALFLGAVLVFYLSFPNQVFVQGSPLLAWGCPFLLIALFDGKDIRSRFFWGLLWGVAAHALLVSWLIPVSIGGWALLTGVLALQGVVLALLFPSGAGGDMLKLFLIPSAWVVSEWARACMMGGFSWSLGNSQGSVPELIQIAAIGGVHAVTWMMVFTAAAMYLAFRTNAGRKRYVLLAAGAVISLFVGGAVRMMLVPQGPFMVRVAAVQPNILREDKLREELYDENAMRHLALSKKVVMAGALSSRDLVLWPETAFTDDVLTDLKWRPRLEQMARNMGVNMLIGSALLWEGHDFNSALLLSSQGVWRNVYHKMRLVPFSEFTPRGAEGLAAALGIGKNNFTPGTRPGVMPLSEGAFLGVAICSEELYPDVFRHLSSDKPAVNVVILNDGWFLQPQALFLHALAAPLRAVESGVGVVRAANTGRTCAFDPQGRRIGREVALQRSGVAIFDMPLSSGKTFYAIWGDVFAVLCLGFVIITACSRIILCARSR